MQPTKLSESDFAAQARAAAAKAAMSAQAGAKTAQQGFSRFVEGPSTGGYRSVPMDEDKREFWDNFSSIADKQASSSIGTAAMGKGGMGTTRGGAAPPPSKSAKDEWDDW